MVNNITLKERQLQMIKQNKDKPVCSGLCNNYKSISGRSLRAGAKLK